MQGNSYYYSSVSNSNQNKEVRPADRDQPIDSVSSIIWDQQGIHRPSFIATSWDGYVRYYMMRPVNSVGSTGTDDIELAWSFYCQHPVLCCDIHPDKIIFAGIATGDIAAIKMSDNSVVRIGFHDSPICGVFWLKQHKVLVSLGFDRLVRFWTPGNDRPQLEWELPLKTHSCSFDWPYLLICSAESTICVVNLKNLRNAQCPRRVEDYFKASQLQLFSKINSSRIRGGDVKKIIVGTVDGKVQIYNFRESHDSITITENAKLRSQKMTKNSCYGQVNCVDLAYVNFETFAVAGGSEQLNTININKKIKGSVLTSVTSSLGASTACRLNPKCDAIVFATGSDWSKGLNELQNMKRPKIAYLKLSQQQVKDSTAK